MDLGDVREYCLSKPFVTEDQPFGEGYITFRVAEKIFCCIALNKGQLVQLKWNPDEFDEIVETFDYVQQAWHWHKRHMIQFDLNEYTIPGHRIKSFIDRAYDYVVSRLPRKEKVNLGIILK